MEWTPSRRNANSPPPRRNAPQTGEARPNRDPEQEGRTERQPRSGTRREAKPPRGRPTRNAKRSLTPTQKKKTQNVLGHNLWFSRNGGFFYKKKKKTLRISAAMCNMLLFQKQKFRMFPNQEKTQSMFGILVSCFIEWYFLYQTTTLRSTSVVRNVLIFNISIEIKRKQTKRNEEQQICSRTMTLCHVP